MHAWRMTLAVALPAIALATGVRADTPQELANRKTVLAFYEQAFGEKDVAAARQYLGSGYIEHDPSIADGPDGLSTYLTRLKDARPRSRHEVTQVVAEGDQVVLHVHVVDAPGSKGESMAHIYRLDGGRIVEHWGMTQAVPDKPNPDNPNSAFGLAVAAGATAAARARGTGPGKRATSRSSPTSTTRRSTRRTGRKPSGSSGRGTRSTASTPRTVPAGFAIWSTV